MVHTVCLLLDCRKRKISATIFLLSNSEENLSSFLLLPGNSLLLKSLLHSLQISWLISCSEMPSPIHRLRKKKVQPLPEASSRAGLGSPGTSPTAGAQKDQVRLWCRQLPLACESLWELTVGELRIIGIVKVFRTPTQQGGKQQIEALILPGREGMK